MIHSAARYLARHPDHHTPYSYHHTRRSMVPLIFAAALLLFAACGSDTDTPPATADGPTTTTPETDSAAGADPAPQPDDAPDADATPQPGGPTEEPSPLPAPIGAGAVRLEVVSGGQFFERPIEVLATPPAWGARAGVLLIAEQDGRVLLLQGDERTTVLDLRDRVESGGNEEGLLSLALDPRFEADAPYLYAYYSVSGGERRTRLSRFGVQAGAVDAATEVVLLEVPQPFSNHNGGAIRFGPADGMLYLGLGDGGSGGDPLGHGQNPETLLGSILRLDVRGATRATPYTIPPDNPFVGGGGRAEVWAYGLRNPWRMAFDPPTGDLWVGDVGQDRVEEIDIVVRGGNYGWNRVEGDRCYLDGCDVAADGLPPVATYEHQPGCSVTGGAVYRGQRVPELQGHYVYADFCSGQIWALPPGAEAGAEAGGGAGGGEPIELLDTDLNIASISLLPDGELLLADFGQVFRLVPGP